MGSTSRSGTRHPPSGSTPGKDGSESLRRVESANRAPSTYPATITATGLTGEPVAPTNFKGAQTKSKRWCPLELASTAGAGPERGARRAAIIPLGRRESHFRGGEDGKNRR